MILISAVGEPPRHASKLQRGLAPALLALGVKRAVAPASGQGATAADELSAVLEMGLATGWSCVEC